MTFTHEIIDEKQVYTRQEEGSPVAHRNIWQDGKLLYRQLIGVQGEVLESEESPRLPVDNDGNPLYEKDEMNPLRYSSCWQNVYDCILPDYSKKKCSVRLTLISLLCEINFYQRIVIRSAFIKIDSNISWQFR